MRRTRSGVTAALDPETSPAPKPTAAKSLSRKVVDGAYVDTDNNSTDFELSTASPRNINIEPADPDPSPDPVSDPTVPEVPVDTGLPIAEPDIVPPTETAPLPEVVSPDPVIPIDSLVLLLPPKITELYPDPAAPETDADDEFVELFNPNPVDMTLTNFKLQTGSTFSHSFSLSGVTIPAGRYLALKSSDTSLALSNSGGAARMRGIKRARICAPQA